MNKLLYATKTNHSRKLAEAIGRAMGLPAENIASNPEVKGVDLLIVVGGIYGKESLPELLDFLRGLDGKEVRRAALVTSCASKKQGQAGVRRILKEKGIRVLDEFICQGSILFVGIGHPNGKDEAQAVAFAERMARGE